MYRHACATMSTDMCTDRCTQMCVHVRTCVLVCARTHVCSHACGGAHMLERICAHMCTGICADVRRHVCVHACASMCIYLNALADQTPSITFQRTSSLRILIILERYWRLLDAVEVYQELYIANSFKVGRNFDLFLAETLQHDGHRGVFHV